MFILEPVSISKEYILKFTSKVQYLFGIMYHSIIRRKFSEVSSTSETDSYVMFSLHYTILPGLMVRILDLLEPQNRFGGGVHRHQMSRTRRCDSGKIWESKRLLFVTFRV